MTRFVHDQFAQEYLPQLFNNYGTVVSSANVTAEIRQGGGRISDETITNLFKQIRRKKTRR